MRSKIFDPFVTSKSEGLGLGLWMVKLYVELIGGKISVNSSAGKGTTFRVTLPPWEK
jgi:signal transduction histidine kinase